MTLINRPHNYTPTRIAKMDKPEIPRVGEDSKHLKLSNTMCRWIQTALENCLWQYPQLSTGHLRSQGFHICSSKDVPYFPGGAVVENPPANAGDAGSSPGLGRSHMPQSNWAREPQLLSLRVWSLCSATREAAIARGPRTAMKSGPCLPELEKALAQKRRPNTAINKIN